MNVAIVGCGFISECYLKTLAAYPELILLGVMDRDSERATHISNCYKVPKYNSLEELLEDSRVEIVLNLTNPKSHFAVSQACLKAGKHVYSEKPLSMNLLEAEELVRLAEQKGLYLSSAPCSLLGETAQSIWKALREEKIGPVYLVYAEMDDGLLHRMPYQKWQSESGIPWPYKDEFEVGCTLEHAGYYLTWLPAFFGPVKTVTAFSSCLIPFKETDVPLEVDSPDFSVACITFASGVVARLTCSIIAPHDHSLQIIGDRGIIGIDDCWHYHAPVHIRRFLKIRRKTFLSPWKEKYPLLKMEKRKINFKGQGSLQMDFCRGVAELANAIKEQRPCRLGADYSLHVNEVVLAIHNALENSSSYEVKSTFKPIEPMPWAKSDPVK
jgi:predicted dehydrogenase